MSISGYKRIAERYVKALFAVAQETSSIDAVEADMRALAKALETSADFQHFLNNPLLPQAARAKVMTAVLDKVGASKTTRQFIDMLLRQKRLALLPVVSELFMEWAASARGELKAELISATALKEKEVAAIAERLSKAYGRKMNLQTRQDPALLGGVVVKIGSQQLDASLAGKLARLGQRLKTA